MARTRSALTDMQLLEILDLMDRHGMTALQVAPRYGKTRNAIIGLRHRILTDLEASEVGAAAMKPENRDGGMPADWWRKRVAC